ncbi:ubiquitin carboxyl terminal hydrolase [Vairimorpha apis BRL 01]|uniref:Ubiquitin carboxyl terminal hydrolase n=1 Tax=Vairimorpha apis BRL 01 TaxID=1037528 RepID=T0MGC4_9MICR|nr:ubiquitin carboxyl terminal hydrolase [Vairimorpha apis BRL 01]
MVVRTNRFYLEPKGMKNLGNTCFFNSSMQCLLSINEFVSFYKSTSFSSAMPVSLAFSEFIKNYESSSNVYPDKLISILRKKINIFNGEQQDAHEFVLRFLEILHNELPTIKNINCKEIFLEHCDQNIISNLFYSLNKQIVSCMKCGSSSESFVLLNMMQVDVCETTQKSLDKVFKDEEIDGSGVWKCERCGYTKSAIKKLEVIIYPKVLILYIKRFTTLLGKNTKHIIVDDKIKLENSLFYLMGVCCHNGSINSGHYISDCKRAGKWMNYNDTNVSSNVGNYNGSNPYMIFYTKTI